MRLLPALIGALLITLVVFLFMHSLIQRGKEEGVPVMVYDDVQIIQPEPEQPEPEEAQAEADSEPVDEPTMEPLTVAPVSPAAPVPEVAWQNKIDGWVLVAFSVTSQGRTRDVRVLDASPRGVFEEKVMAAVEDWTYRISASDDIKGDIILTQKVEVRWQNYPQNLPNVD